MTPDPAITSPEDQRVTFVELFFDLVFVYCVTRVVGLFHGHVDLPTAGRALLVFWLVWWAWTQFTWALNAANTDHPRIQVFTLLATAIAFFMGVGIPGAVGPGALWFAVPYVVVRSVGLLLYHWVAWRDPQQRRAVRIFGGASLLGLAAVLAGALLGGAAQVPLWGLAIGLDLLAAGVGGQAEGWHLHPDHFVERHGLIVIIALGETLIVAASGLTGAERRGATLTTGALAVAVTCGLWWTYFRQARPTLEHALAEREDNARSRLARDAFSVLHFPMLLGVIGMAVATEEALANPDQALGTPLRAMLAGGALLFVVGTGAALHRATGRPTVARWIVMPVAAGGILLGGARPSGALSILLAALIAVAAIEHRVSGTPQGPRPLA